MEAFKITIYKIKQLKTQEKKLNSLMLIELMCSIMNQTMVMTNTKNHQVI